ncbi:unnamed protein product [Symbiodinium natans]|uniref:Glycosyl transferase family 25 domain-containing protein n=1 Tax=Symbiodinium natans TaxID=878477 RepID=A0A812U3L9_9DINO|nr:unnamed protein product [Symbiodinium natans]
MTPGAVGCALSHRVLWESLASEVSLQDWLLVLEDDLLWVASDLEQRLAQVVRELPSDWHLCYVGWHGQAVIRLALGDAGLLKTSGPLEPWSGCDPLGTFAYLVSRAGARELLRTGSAFPLRRQLDAQRLGQAAGKVASGGVPGMVEARQLIGLVRFEPAYARSDFRCALLHLIVPKCLSLFRLGLQLGCIKRGIRASILTRTMTSMSCFRIFKLMWPCSPSLFYSAPCQLLDSDVQAIWSAGHAWLVADPGMWVNRSADHTTQLRPVKLGLRARAEALNAISAFDIPRAVGQALDRLAARAYAFSALMKFAQARMGGIRLPLWHPSVPSLEALAPFFLVRPRIHAAIVLVEDGRPKAAILQEAGCLAHAVAALLRAIGPGAVLIVWYGSQDPDFLASLRAAAGLPSGALLCRPLPAAEVGVPGADAMCHKASLWTNFRSLLALLGLCTEELFLIGGSDLEAVRGSVEAFPRDLPALSEHCVAALPPCRSMHLDEEALAAAFQEIKRDPSASYVGLEHTALAEPFDPHIILFRRRAWARLATWVREMFRLAARLRAVARGGNGQAEGARAVAAARCVLGLAGLPPRLVAPNRGADSFERCD